MERNNYTIALLIDAENISAKYMSALHKELVMFGKVTYKRIYGDFTSSHTQWKSIINDYALTPIQQFSYTTGKNATDSKIIIDAMDILHSKTVDAVCIMSSDSDYTGLVKRLKESNIFVIGAGESKTPIAFVNACDRFLDVKLLCKKYDTTSQIETETQVTDIDEQQATASEGVEEQDEKSGTEITQPQLVQEDEQAEKKELEENDAELTEELEIITKEEIENFVYHLLEARSGLRAPLEEVMNKIYQAYPHFSLQHYGVKKVYRLFDDRFNVEKAERGSNMYIELVEKTPIEDEIWEIAKKILMKESSPLNIGTLCAKIYKDETFSHNYPDFRFRQGEFKKFLRENDSFELEGDGAKTVVRLR